MSSTPVSEAAPATTPAVLEVSDTAAAKIVALAERDHHAPILRVRVLAGGCSGFTYDLAFADDSAEGDIVINRAGATVLVDQASAPILVGSTLEFINSMMEGGLKVVNPQAVHECACGQSFSV